jgi:hypothetical protein
MSHGAWLWGGLVLALVSWWVAWFGVEPARSYAFFPLWLGYILTVDGLAYRRTGTSLLARSPREFGMLLLFSVPLWWLFESANHFLGNWRYLLPRPWDTLTYTLMASLSFSTVMPAIFVSAELLTTFKLFSTPRHWRKIDLRRRSLLTLSLAGVAIFALSLALPRFLFPLVWIGLFLALDPINLLLGNPSLLAQVRCGRWQNVLTLSAAGLLCRFFWEMWNVNAMPKWVYNVPMVDHMAKLFEMPLLGYGGYLPFALEVFAVWSFLRGLFSSRRSDWPNFAFLSEASSADDARGTQSC